MAGEAGCLLIGSYGSEHIPGIQNKVRYRLCIKPGHGKFLPGVDEDLRRVQSMIAEDSHGKRLMFVLPDYSGAQKSRSYFIDKIDEFFKNCMDDHRIDQALIWYSGHGGVNTGNWCFKDGFISFEDVFNSYYEHFRGKKLTIVSDCCFAGNWTIQCAELLDRKCIPACGHKAKEEVLVDIFASCKPDESAYDGVYAQQCVKVDSKTCKMVFSNNPVNVPNHHHLVQSPVVFKTSKITCFSKDRCNFEKIPEKWLWKDLLLGNKLHLRLKRIRLTRNRISYIFIHKNKLEEFHRLEKKGSLPDNLGSLGYIIRRGYGATPPQIEELICKFGPVHINFSE